LRKSHRGKIGEVEKAYEIVINSTRQYGEGRGMLPKSREAADEGRGWNGWH